MKKHRPPGLIAIVLYKSFVASLLTVTSIALLLSLNSHHFFEAFSAYLFLETKLNIVKYLLAKILILKPPTLLFSELAIGMPAILTVIESLSEFMVLKRLHNKFSFIASRHQYSA